MSKIYSLTKVGKRAYRDSSVSGDELLVLEHLVSNKSASDDQLEVVAGSRWILKDMKRHGLIKELTT